MYLIPGKMILLHQPAIAAPLRVPCRKPDSPVRRPPLTVVAALNKRSERFLSSLSDTPFPNRVINKFVTSSSKSVALDALSRLLSPDQAHHRGLSSLALPLYSKITETAWFEWNPKLVAQLAALLDSLGLTSESETLIADSVAKLRSDRDLSNFLGHLVEFHASHGSARGFDESYERLRRLVGGSSSAYVKRQGYKSMVKGLCDMGRPREAESLLAVIEEAKVGPTVFELRCVIYGYGRLGFLDDMERVFDSMSERKGFGSDTASFSLMLGCCGAHGAVTRVVVWVRRMKEIGVPLTMRACNAVFDSCPTIMGLLGGGYPVEMDGLVEALGAEGDEAALVADLAEGALGLEGVMTWDESEGKLDLHGMHVGAAYVVMLEWMQELRRRFGGDGHRNGVVPAEITVVSGLGNHSRVRGESPVRCLVREMVFRTGIPMRVDRDNKGCFIAKGKVIEEWIRRL